MSMFMSALIGIVAGVLSALLILSDYDVQDKP